MSPFVLKNFVGPLGWLDTAISKTVLARSGEFSGWRVYLKIGFLLWWWRRGKANSTQYVARVRV